MFKIISISILTILLCTAQAIGSGAGAAKKRIVFNPGNKAHNGWIFVASQAKIKGVWDPTIKRDDGKSGALGIEHKSQAAGYGAWRIKPALKFEPGKSYTISAWVKHSKIKSKQSTFIEVYNFNKAGKPKALCYSCLNPAQVDTWYKVSGTFKVPADSARIRTGFDMLEAGTLWLGTWSCVEKK